MKLRGPLIAALLAAAPAWAGTWFWVDAEGVTHVTDDPSLVPPEAQDRDADREALRELWGDVRGPVEPTGRGVAEDRTLRLLRGAVEDLARGENARASATLYGILRDAPGRPEAHWYLALLDRQRGRYDSAEAHLRAFLASAGDGFEPWRVSAERRLAALEDERRLADPNRAEAPAWIGLSSRHFRVLYDSALGESSTDYAQRVLRYLDEARDSVGARLGAVPAEPMGVVLYGKAAYLQAHRHRFSFQTVGFFDGRIHVVSAAHPAGELRALLFHEYVHAVFREQTGGDRPFWLNEGMAEISERASLQRRALTRSERAALSRRIDQGRWIPLSRLAPSFSGLEDDDARAAYLESTAAAAWLESHSDSAQRAELLRRLGEGAGDDQALRDAIGLDTAGVEAAVRAALRAEFPEPPEIGSASAAE